MTENTNTETESTEEQEQESEEPVHIGTFPGSITLHRGDFEIPAAGQLVRDPEGDRGEGVVLFVRDQAAFEAHVAATGKTVAEHNPDHPPEAPVVGVAYKGQLREKFEDQWEAWRRTEPEYLAFRAGNSGVSVYDFPCTRLEWGADAGIWRCEECETLINELELSGDQREAGGPCPECEEMALKRIPRPEEVEE